MTLAFIDVGPTPAPSAVTATANDATVVSSSGASAQGASCACGALDATVVVSNALVQFDLLPSSPFPLLGEIVQPAQALTRSISAFPATTLYVGMIVAPSWLPSHAYTLGQYVTVGSPSVFASGVDRFVQICTTAGTSGSTEPPWNQTPGGATADGSGALGWTEASLLFGNGTMTGCEPTSAEYARASLDNSSPILFGDPRLSTPNPIVQWPTAVHNWGTVVGIFLADAPTGGNIYAWGLTTTVTPVAGSGTAGIGPAPSMSLTQGFVQGVLCSTQVLNFGSTPGTSFSFGVTQVPSGGTIVVVVPFTASSPGVTVTGCTDPNGTVAHVSSAYTTYTGIAIYTITGCAQGSHSITVTMSGSAQPAITAFVYMGTRTVTPGSTGVSDAFVGQAAIPGSQVIVGSIAPTAVATVPAGWVQSNGPLSGGVIIAPVAYNFVDTGGGLGPGEIAQTNNNAGAFLSVIAVS